jgi:8-oxo-dGTP pyrophosphatase MutT (NUDIX family)
MFAVHASAVLVFVVDRDDRTLLLGSGDDRPRWEVVNGALESGETLSTERSGS